MSEADAPGSGVVGRAWASAGVGSMTKAMQSARTSSASLLIQRLMSVFSDSIVRL